MWNYLPTMLLILRNGTSGEYVRDLAELWPEDWAGWYY